MGPARVNTEVGCAVAAGSWPPAVVTGTKLLVKLGPLLGLAPVQRGLKRLVELTISGPTAEERQRGRSEIWGEVRNAAGRRLTATMTTPEGYELTADSCVRAVSRVLAGVEPGALTPSMAFGADFVRELDGVVVHDLQRD